jgi:hypothetical protein
MSKRTASEVEDDTVANVAEVVWGFLTGRVNESDMDHLRENMSEMDKVRHYEMLRRTDKAAAERFSPDVPDKVDVYLTSWTGSTIRRTFFITKKLDGDIWYPGIGTSSSLEREFFEHVRSSLPADFVPRPYIKLVWRHYDGEFGGGVTKHFIA